MLSCLPASHRRGVSRSRSLVSSSWPKTAAMSAASSWVRGLPGLGRPLRGLFLWCSPAGCAIDHLGLVAKLVGQLERPVVALWVGVSEDGHAAGDRSCQVFLLCSRFGFRGWEQVALELVAPGLYPCHQQADAASMHLFIQPGRFSGDVPCQKCLAPSTGALPPRHHHHRPLYVRYSNPLDKDGLAQASTARACRNVPPRSERFLHLPCPPLSRSTSTEPRSHTTPHLKPEPPVNS